MSCKKLNLNIHQQKQSEISQKKKNIFVAYKCQVKTFKCEQDDYNLSTRSIQILLFEGKLLTTNFKVHTGKKRIFSEQK